MYSQQYDHSKVETLSACVTSSSPREIWYEATTSTIQ